MKHQQNPEQGAVLVLTALTMVSLLVMAALVVDYGNSRQVSRQAQSSADAAALVAVRAVWNDGSTPNWTGAGGAVSQVKSYAFVNYGVNTNSGWMNCADSAASAYWSSVGVSTVYYPDSGIGNYCISADQQLNPTRIRVAMPVKNLPTVFGRAAGVTQTQVRASAVAEVTFGQLVLAPGVVSLKKGSSCVGIDLRGSEAAKVSVIGGSVVVNCGGSPPVSFSGSNAEIDANGSFYSVGNCSSTNACTNGGTVASVVQLGQAVSDPLAGVPDLSSTDPGVVYSGPAGGLPSCLANKTGLTYGYYYVTGGNPPFIPTCSGARAMIYLAGTAALDDNVKDAVVMNPPLTGPYAGISIFMARGNTGSIGENANSKGTVSTGTIYARDGNLGNGGNIDWDVTGQVVVSTITMKGGGGKKNPGLVVTVPSGVANITFPSNTGLVH